MRISSLIGSERAFATTSGCENLKKDNDARKPALGKRIPFGSRQVSKTFGELKRPENKFSLCRAAFRAKEAAKPGRQWQVREKHKKEISGKSQRVKNQA
jgi:hypothetical protein